ncbi:hypothetical protein CBR_g48527 [Chara braunii]|uniref:Integrase catalytic domain-containing protein n=1 Tax=Chara braunii TaxID=69332 RepID=A0A388M337_CHABU|nr:hypothetical protein CBR_g48527 [Chara braunii]|eukprot:GBG88915.1 hypothetical protein CBR_g48527 [Chara braunii]
MMEALTEGIIELDDRKYVMWADEGKSVPFLPSMKINVDIKRRRMNEAKGKLAQESVAAKVSRVIFEEDLDELPESPGMRISSIKFEEKEDNGEVYVCTQGVGESSKGKKEDQDQPMMGEQVESPKSPQSPRKRGAKKFHLKSSLDEVDLREPLRRAMEMSIRITLKEFIASCGPARDELIGMIKKAKVPLAEAAVLSEPKIKTKTFVLAVEKGEVEHLETNDGGGDYFYVLGSGKLNATVNGIRMKAIVDDGSESTVCEDKVARKLGLEVDRNVAITMVSANKPKQPALGVCHKAKVVVAGVEATVPVFTVEHCSSELILGRTWLTRVNATTENKHDGSQTVTIDEPEGSRVTLKTVNEFDKRHKVSLQNKGLLKTRSCQMIPEEVTLGPHKVKEAKIEVEDSEGKYVVDGMAYEKEVDDDEFGGRDRTGEVEITEKEITQMIRERKATEEQRITDERIEGMDMGDGNITKEERELIIDTLRAYDKAIVFCDAERGRIDPRYAKPARIYTVPHVPWNDVGWKCVQKEKEMILNFLKEKIRTFVAEPCESAYANRWFFIRKSNEKLRWIQDLQKMNKVTVRDARSIPNADLLSEGAAGRSIYSVCDLFSGYDEILLDYRDRHLTAMHTRLGLIQMMVVPMGWTNGVAVFQREMVVVLGELIPNLVEVFLDDFPIKGPYEKDETVVRPGIRRFVATHVEDIKKVLVKLEDANLTVSGTKSRWALSSIQILGYIFDKDGRRPDPAKLEKLMNWPTPLRHITDIRQLLGVVGFLKNFIKGYAGKAEPLRRLFRKRVEWSWTSEKEDTVKALKDEFKEGGQVLGVPYFEDEEKRPFVMEIDSMRMEPSTTRTPLFLENLFTGKYHRIERYLIGDAETDDKVRKEAQQYCLKADHLFKRPPKNGMSKRVVCDEDEQRDIIAELHDVVGGHTGVEGTFEKVRNLYWWDGLYRDVEAYCLTCVECQKRVVVKYREPLFPSYPTTVGQKIHVDLVKMRKGEGGMNYIMDIRDDLTGFVEAWPLRQKTGKAVSGYLTKYITRYGCVGKIVMDRRSEFMAKEVQELLQ